MMYDDCLAQQDNNTSDLTFSEFGFLLWVQSLLTVLANNQLYIDIGMNRRNLN